MLQNWIYLALAAVGTAQKLAPLELDRTNGILFGVWFDRKHGAIPSEINKKFNYKPLSLWQSDVNITETLQADYVDDIFTKITQTQTNAIIYLTVYPIEGFEKVSDAALNQLAQKVRALTTSGSKLFIRYASEMNGAWFTYGQKPTEFINSWKKFVGTIRDAAGKDNVAFIWAPNSANGYPFKKNVFSQEVGMPTFDNALDTNKDGVYDDKDDPFTPFYPGDEWVDWVGMSMYHYGTQFPWTDNAIPERGKAECIMTGCNGISQFNFYRMFAGDGSGAIPRPATAGGKPMIITETAATVHVAGITFDGTPHFIPPMQDPESRAQIKRAWWRQILNETFLNTYPKIKAVSFFEFFKFEEATWRDFSILGGDGNLTSPYGDDGSAMNGATLRAFQQDMRGSLGNLIHWADPGKVGQLVGSAVPPVVGSNPNPGSKNDASTISSLASSLLSLLAFIIY